MSVTGVYARSVRQKLGQAGHPDFLNNLGDSGSEDCYRLVYPLCAESMSRGRVSKWKKRDCLATGAARLVRAAIWAWDKGVNSRAICTFSSSCVMLSQPRMTVLTG